MWLVPLDTIVCALVVIVLLGVLVAQARAGVSLGDLLEAQQPASRGMADEPDLYELVVRHAPPQCGARAEPGARVSPTARRWVTPPRPKRIPRVRRSLASLDGRPHS